MKKERSRAGDHLKTEQLEVLALERGRQLPSGAVAHLQECASCGRELGELRRLHSALALLAALGPAAGFTDRVMARVRLPLPLRVRILEVVRAHRLAAAAALAGVIGATAGSLVMQAQYPDLTPMALAVFLLNRSMALMWSGVMAVGRLLYDSGLAAGVEGLIQQLTIGGALLLLATLSLVGLGALRILMRLMDHSTEAARQAVGR
jgi:hypothetical protein